MVVEPLPFKLRLPGRDTLGFDGARSEWRRVLDFGAGRSTHW